MTAVDQKSNGNLVYIANPFGLREITPLGEEVDRLVEPACNTTSPQGQYHHEVQVQPNDEVLFLGTVMHPVSGDLAGTHGMQVNDTIEKWDQKTQPATADRLFDEFFFIPQTDRTAPSSNLTGGFFWRGCPEVSGVEDWTHSNSIHVGPSGNIIVSIRHLNQVIANLR